MHVNRIQVEKIDLKSKWNSYIKQFSTIENYCSIINWKLMASLCEKLIHIICTANKFRCYPTASHHSVDSVTYPGSSKPWRTYIFIAIQERSFWLALLGSGWSWYLREIHLPPGHPLSIVCERAALRNDLQIKYSHSNKILLNYQMWHKPTYVFLLFIRSKTIMLLLL